MELSAFDLDQTLIQGNTSADFCRYLHQKGVLPFSILCHAFLYGFRHRFLGMSLSQLHHSVFNRVLFGKPLEVLEQHLEEFVKETIDKNLYIPAFTCLQKAQKEGQYTMILSNAPSFLVECFAKFLGVNLFKGTEYALDENRCFARVKKIFEGKDKALFLEKIADKLNIFLDQITVYSDSILDLEFLRIAGRPIAVNPDKKLRNISLENQWGII